MCIMQDTPLEKTLGTNASFKVDIGSLVLHVHKLIVLASPLVRVAKLLARLRRWEASGVSMFILIIANTACLLPTGYYMSFVVGLLLLIGGLGVAHRHTRCLVKVFPPSNLNHEDLNPSDGTLTHSEMSMYYRAMLYKVDSTVVAVSEGLISFYSILKWENIQVSVRWYISLLILLICLHMMPLRYTVVMVINLFLLEGKISQVLIDRAQYKQEKLEEEKRKSAALQAEDPPESLVSQTSIESTSSDLCAGGGSAQSEDTDSELSDKDEEMSSSENSDNEAPSTSENTGQGSAEGQVKAKSRGASVVGKILEFKKKHQTAAAGNCVGCNVTFSTILKRRHICTHCGNHFCSRCCSRKVPRAMMGATAPSAQTETVPVCSFCYMYLTGKKEKPS